MLDIADLNGIKCLDTRHTLGINANNYLDYRFDPKHPDALIRCSEVKWQQRSSSRTTMRRSLGTANANQAKAKLLSFFPAADPEHTLEYHRGRDAC